jgi:hypothetical protein
MFRLSLVFIMFLLPVASAGISTSTDTLPPPTFSCDGSGDSQSDGSSWSDNGSYSYHYEGSSWSTSSCGSTNDVARANATSNGHEVASARVGDGSDSDHAHGSSGRYDASGYHNNGSSFSSNSESQNSYSSNQWSAGREARLSTFAGDVRAFDGCESRSGNSNQSASQSWSSNRPNESAWSNWGSQWASNTDHSDCGRTVTADSGVTDAQAGESDRCDENAWENRAWQDSYDSGGSRSWNYSYEGDSRQCASDKFVQAGSERIAVGTYEQCNASSSSGSYSDPYGSGGSSSSYERCDTRTGVFGPDGFAIFLQDIEEDQRSCDDTGGCTESSWDSQQVGAQHDLVGGVFMPLP